MFNNKDKDKSKENFLLYRPLRKIELWDVNDEKVKLFFHHNKPIERCLRWLIRKPKVNDIVLDARGSMVWILCDGNNTVYDIAQTMVEKFNETEQESIDKLIMFVRYLSRSGWITFENKKI
ncbi:PqqD family protein [Clostridium sp.]|uniref:PqqD family protein n=1 Tax=Clostridium sp. TaxID=1506 RepID=UPI001A3B4B8F|nr:PqqD family protein [Clostridium sp.]MBK5239653.1 PqqD family protein [Clostridium sp.]